ncbi:Hypothetical protein, putative [Bodo saltans]|uniref:Uncharacterized protein n=1 Tax=Bodo saltans TaxID=75058 RepID=A0A0S4II17_BODSA|nr:Hypothetical protein, putative [Bodo saltans]|eukprot:CUE70073.1 Hypothetical protein, putative [Bodo saltans]
MNAAQPLRSSSSSSSSSNSSDSIMRQLDDDEWLDNNEDGVLFSVLGNNNPSSHHYHRSSSTTQQGGHDTSVSDAGRIIFFSQGCDGEVDRHAEHHHHAHVSPDKRAFDSVSESSTVSLDRQITAFHEESEVALTTMLQLLRDRTLSMTAMEEAEEVLRSSSPIEWNPYRPPRGERFRARLEAMQVLEWRAFAERELAVAGNGCAAPETEHEQRSSWKIQAEWFAPCVANESRHDDQQHDTTSSGGLEVLGHRIRLMGPPVGVLHHEDCAYGGVTEEMIEQDYNHKGNAHDGHEDDDGGGEYELMYASTDPDEHGTLAAELDARRAQSGLPHLLPEAVAAHSDHDAEVTEWWASIAEPLLRSAGLLDRYYNGGRSTTTTADNSKNATPTTVSGGRCDVLTFGDSDVGEEALGSDAVMRDSYHQQQREVLPHRSSMHARFLPVASSEDDGDAETTTRHHGGQWTFAQKTPQKGAVNRHLRRPSAPPSIMQTTRLVVKDGGGSGDERVGMPPLTSVVLDAVDSANATTRSSRASVRKGLPGRPQHKKASSLSPPPRRTRSSEVKAPSFVFGSHGALAEGHQDTGPSGSIEEASLASLLVVRGDTVPTRPVLGSAGNSGPSGLARLHSSGGGEPTAQPARQLKAGGRLSPIVPIEDDMNGIRMTQQQTVQPPLRQRTESTRRVPTREQQHAALLALEDDLSSQQITLASALALNSIAGAFHGGGAPPMDSLGGGRGGGEDEGFSVVGRTCMLNDRGDHLIPPHDDVNGTSSTTTTVVRLPDIHAPMGAALPPPPPPAQVASCGRPRRVVLQTRRFFGASNTTTTRAHTAYVRPSAKKSSMV